jgi:hypothetical protein
VTSPLELSHLPRSTNCWCSRPIHPLTPTPTATPIAPYTPVPPSSCEPNCEWQNWDVRGEQRLCLFTLRGVTAGEELTVDYAFRAHATAESACACGAARCAGRVPEVLA